MVDVQSSGQAGITCSKQLSLRESAGFYIHDACLDPFFCNDWIESEVIAAFISSGRRFTYIQGMYYDHTIDITRSAAGRLHAQSRRSRHHHRSSSSSPHPAASGVGCRLGFVAGSERFKLLLGNPRDLGLSVGRSCVEHDSPRGS